MSPEVVQEHTICPDESEGGARKPSTYASKTRASVAPSTAIASPIPPSRVIEAMSVVFLPRFVGTLPYYALSPLGALALARVMDVCVPHSSTATKRLGSTDPIRSPKAALSRSSRSCATRDFF